MDKFVEQIQTIERQSHKTLQNQQAREKQLEMKKTVFDDDFELEEERVDINKQIFQFQDQIGALKERLKIIKSEKAKIKEKKNEEAIQQIKEESYKYERKRRIKKEVEKPEPKE